MLLYAEPKMEIIMFEEDIRCTGDLTGASGGDGGDTPIEDLIKPQSI